MQASPMLLHPCHLLLLLAPLVGPCPMHLPHSFESALVALLLLLLLACPKLLPVLWLRLVCSSLLPQQRGVMVRSLLSRWLSCLMTGAPCHAWEGAARVWVHPSLAQLLPVCLPPAAACSEGHAAARCCVLLLGPCRQGGL